MSLNYFPPTKSGVLQSWIGRSRRKIKGKKKREKKDNTARSRLKAGIKVTKKRHQQRRERDTPLPKSPGI